MGAESADTTRVTLLHRLNQNPADQLSWAEFVRFYGPAIRGWLTHWGLQEADAQDVAQNVLLRLTAKLPQYKYDPSKRFRGWLKTLTHHAWHDFVTEAGYRTRGMRRHQRTRPGSNRWRRARALAARVGSHLRQGNCIEMAAPAREGAGRGDDVAGVQARRGSMASPQVVADQLGVRVSQVYLAKHRVQKLVQEEIRAAGGRTTCKEIMRISDC